MQAVSTDVEGSVAGSPAPEAPGVESDPSGGWWRQIRTHVVLLAVILVVVASMTDLTSSWTSDDGSYAASVRLVRDHGTWMYPDEPDWANGLSEPAMVNGTVTEEGLYPYVRQPAWIMALVLSSSLVPEPLGLYVLQIVGLLLGAATAWWVALRVRAEADVLAFWVVGSAPAIVWAFGLWAHVPMVLMGGVVAWGLVRISDANDRVDVPVVAAMALAAAVAVSLRSEGLVLVVSALMGSTWSIVAGSGRRRAARALVTGAVILLAGLGARVLSVAWAARIASGSALPPSGASGGGGSWVSGRISGALATVATTSGASTGAFLLGMLAILIAATVGVRLAEARRIDLVVVTLAVAWMVVAVGRSAMFPLDHLSGLLAAAPLIMAGLAGYRWSGSSHQERSLVVYCVVFVGAVIAIQYDVGGGHEWGGRFLGGALVPLAVVACSTLVGHVGAGALDTSTASERRGAQMRLGTFLLALLVVPAVLATLVTWHGRSRSDGWTREVERAGAPVVVTVDRIGAHIGWRTIPDVLWVRTEPETLHELLERAAAAGEPDMVVYGALVDDVGDLDCEVEALKPRVLRLRC